MTDRQRLEPKILTRAEREARKAFAAQEAEKALSEYEKAQRAFHANRERLKAERLAREAARVENIVSSGQLKLLSRAGPIEFYLPARSPLERQTYPSLLTIGFR